MRVEEATNITRPLADLARAPLSLSGVLRNGSFLGKNGSDNYYVYQTDVDAISPRPAFSCDEF